MPSRNMVSTFGLVDMVITYPVTPGSPVRIGPDYIATDDPVIQRHMNAPRSPFTKGRWFRGMKFDPRRDNLLSMADEKAHADLRSKLMPGVRIALLWYCIVDHEADVDLPVYRKRSS